MQQIYLHNYFKGFGSCLTICGSAADVHASLFTGTAGNPQIDGTARSVRAIYGYRFDHPQKDIIEKRVKVIGFFDEFGERATEEAFSVSRSTIFLWKKIKDADGAILARISQLRNRPYRSHATTL